MAGITSTANSALQGFQQSLEVTAQNVANSNNPQYEPQRAVFQEEEGGGTSVQVQKTAESQVSLGEEALRLSVTSRGFQANLKTIKTQDEMTGSVLNLLG
jgi:flagellar hook-associated protein FlgK